MSAVEEHKAGTFCWIELGTTDTGAARNYYKDLFGWSDAAEQDYVMLKLSGKEVGGLYELTDEMRAHGVPPHWLSYVSVVSADETAKKAESLGATILKEPFDVFAVGRMAVIQDPTGAVFAVWQPRTHIGARVVNEPGSLCWNELATNDVDAAGAFYTKLFDWGSEQREMGPITYTMFMAGDRPAGGMLKMTEEWGDIPPHWMPYLATDDCDYCAEKAKSLGAEVKVPPTDIPSVGRFAVLQDPQGAVISVIKLQEQPQ